MTIVTATIIINLTVQAVNAVCTKSGACAVANPLESSTAFSNTHAITLTPVGGTAADNNKGNIHAFAGGGGSNCAFSPKASQKCASSVAPPPPPP